MFDGIFKSVINPMNLVQLTMGPAGWASLATQALVGTAINQVIQQVGSQLGLPQSLISGAQTAFNQGFGFQPTGTLDSLINNLGDQVGASLTQRAQLSSQMDFFMDRVQEKLQDSIEDAGKESNGGGATTNAKGGFLMRLAAALGSVLDSKMQEMIDTGGKIDKESKSDKPQLGTLSAEMTALGKELDFVSQALNNALKSLGDTASTLARKQ